MPTAKAFCATSKSKGQVNLGVVLMYRDVRMSRSHGCDRATFWFLLQNTSLYFALRAIVILKMFKIVPDDFVFEQAKKSNHQPDEYYLMN